VFSRRCEQSHLTCSPKEGGRADSAAFIPEPIPQPSTAYRINAWKIVEG
jgi:hypothetical protein